MHEDFGFAGDGGNLADGLKGAELVVGVHHGDEDRGGAEGIADASSGSMTPEVLMGEIGDVDAFALEVGRRC